MQRDIIERCEDAISALKQELQELQEKYEENKKEITFLSSTNIKKALVSFYGKSSNDDSTNLKNIQSKLVKCEQEIQFFRTVTGMEFTKYLKKTETKTEKGTIYSHRLVGCCRFLPFEVEFKTLDAQTKSCEVIHINIHVDQKENSDLVKLVSRTHKSLNLLGFFRTISTYTEWFDYRQSTFSQFKDKYPLAVGLPMGSSADYMILMNPDLPGYELLLVWKITITEDGSVTPILDLLPKIPEQAKALDKTGVLENAAMNFRTLLQAFGLQATIENIIQSFCMKRSSH
ncbi:centromere protein P isoform X2 [Hyla sarda]|nr:centromere protein P isoform X2 [Hyla sarda]XP_056380019.1 centromere protein P isoform X2 [Hyla sarda]XP_056380020.1 centromere protein P isoform X2 [Hyla sarda]XP_056380021.1 centromere protein P isoform X2 [Hyla sarda]XP_056380022.1 centromere protein P isoform X2 [Hyla sarda]